MLSLDELAALNLAIWLRSGKEAARRLEVRQSTVSRRCRHGLEQLARWRGMALLRDGVIDTWLTGGPDWPEPDDPDFATLQPCTMPVHLVVTPHHPLLNQAASSWADLPACRALFALLPERLQGWAEHCPEIEVCQPATASVIATDPAAAGGGG
jgi:DNA-binding transcriptional LysR family regulator